MLPQITVTIDSGPKRFTAPTVLNAMGEPITVRTGVFPSLPDLNDYDNRHEEIIPMSDRLGITAVPKEALPKDVDERKGFSDVEDQGPLGSCTAQGGVGLLEFMQRRAFGKHIEMSRMFLYNATKYLLGWEGDSGAYLRHTMAALRLFGCPPEEFYPYDRGRLDDEPSTYETALAAPFKGVTYLRHDAGTNTPPECALLSIKKYLAAGIPSVFGFYGFDSFSDGDGPGLVPIPGPGESAKWAHAVCAAGYNDEYHITNERTGDTTIGAVLFRNSWGVGWGDHGYGWIPYEFFLRRYCWDDWSILSVDWIDTGQFGLGLNK